MSLLRPHPLYTSCGENSYEVSKCIIQARLLSGRYRSDKLLSHFDKSSDHRCRLCLSETGDIEHLLVNCSALSEVRTTQFQAMNSRNEISQFSVDIILTTWEKSVNDFVQLLLDCSVIPEVIRATQNGQNVMQEIFKFSRTWCFNIHAKRMKLLGRWNK